MLVAIGGAAVAAGGYHSVFVINQTTTAAPKLLHQFNSADSLIGSLSNLTRLKSGNLMGTVVGDGEAIFTAISQGGQAERRCQKARWNNHR